MRISDYEMQNVLKSEKLFVVADLETTGFSMNKGAEIIEIGAVQINAETRKIEAKYQTYVKPYRAILSPKIQELTGITPDMIEHARTADIVIPEFASFIGDMPVIFHNASFDWDRFLNPMFRKFGIVKNNPVIDTQVLAKVCYPQLGKYGLKTLCEFFGKGIEGHHEAYSDAKHTAAVALRIRNDLGEQSQMPANIPPAEKEAPTELPALCIYKVRAWNKAKHLKRIYFTTSWGSIYYDIIHKAWFVQNTSYETTIDLKRVEEKIMRLLRIEDRGDLEELFYNQIESAVG